MFFPPSHRQPFVLSGSSKRPPSSLLLLILAFILIVFPFVNLFYAFYPAIAFGKNAWLVMIVFSIVGVYLYTIVFQKHTVRSTNNDIFIIGLSLIVVVIFVIRDIAYSENRSIADFRYTILPFVFFMTIFRIATTEKALRFLALALIISSLLQSIFVIVHTHFFPNVQTIFNPDTQDVRLIYDAVRTRRGLIGASINANQILCGMFITYVFLRRDNAFWRNMFFFGIILLMLYAIGISGSRYPMAFAFILTFLAVLHLFRSIESVFMLVIIAFCFLVVFLSSSGLELFMLLRFHEDYWSRLDKFILSFALLSESFQNFFIGASSAVIASTYSKTGFLVSDNSYWLIALQFGVPFALVFFFSLIRKLWVRRSSQIYKLFFVYLLLGLGITNCLLWESWVYPMILTSIVLRNISPQVPGLKA